MARRLAAALLLISLATAARAEAPEPKKPIDLGRFMGKWYEILRTPNGNQKNCYAAYQVWSQKPDGKFSIKQYCHKDGPDGPEKLVNTSAKVLDPPTNAKFEASFFAGLIRGRYWVVDRADNYDWMIATTEDGNFPALLAREPSLPEGEQSKLKQRMAQLGFNIGKLEAFGVRQIR